MDSDKISYGFETRSYATFSTATRDDGSVEMKASPLIPNRAKTLKYWVEYVEVNAVPRDWCNPDDFIAKVQRFFSEGMHQFSNLPSGPRPNEDYPDGIHVDLILDKMPGSNLHYQAFKIVTATAPVRVSQIKANAAGQIYQPPSRANYVKLRQAMCCQQGGHTGSSSEALASEWPCHAQKQEARRCRPESCVWRPRPACLHIVWVDDGAGWKGCNWEHRGVP